MSKLTCGVQTPRLAGLGLCALLLAFGLGCSGARDTPESEPETDPETVPAAASAADLASTSEAPEPQRQPDTPFIAEPATPEPEPTPEPEDLPANDDPGVATASDTTPQDSANVCSANNMASLTSCLSRARSGDLPMSGNGRAQIVMTSDISCGNNCCPSGTALLNLNGASNISLEGQGRRILRGANQRQCSLLTLHNASDVAVQNVILDDDSTDASCEVTDSCPPMLHMIAARDITMQGVSVRHSKGYAIYVRGTDGFAFNDSTLEHSGVLGLYVGHEDDSSRRVRIERSLFRDNATNAIALLGVDGSGQSTIVAGNTFERNHAFGRWPVEPQFGTGMTGGGQVYIARADGVLMRNNRIVDGYCANCFYNETLGTGVSGIEIGIPGRATVRDMQISNNVIENNAAWGIFANITSSIDASVRVFDNQLRSNGVNLRLPGASIGQNTIVD